MILSEYVKRLEESVTPMVTIADGTDTEIDDEISATAAVSNGKWICKRLRNNSVYLFNNGHWLNLTALKGEMDNYYSSKGYANTGYDKLTDSEMVNYKTVKEIFTDLISRSLGNELDPKETAESMFNREILTN